MEISILIELTGYQLSAILIFAIAGFVFVNLIKYYKSGKEKQWKQE